MATHIPPKEYASDSESEDSDLDDHGVKRELYDEERQRIEEELKEHVKELKKSPYKVVLVGDQGVGKTRLLKDLRARAIAAGVEQSSSNAHQTQVSVVKYVLQSQHVKFENLSMPTIFFESVENEGSSDINPASDPYKEADTVLLCFNVEDRNSFENIRAKWSEVLKKSCPDLPTCLVGMRGETDGGHGGTKTEIKPSQARKLSRKLLSQAYIDLSGSVTKEDQVPELLQQAASDARYGRLIRRRNLTGTNAREGDALPERIMLYTVGAFAAGPALIISGIAAAQASGLGMKPLIRKARERSQRSKMAKSQS